MKKIVYRNIEFEKKTKADLETSRAAMQKVLGEWLKLEIGPCMGLNDLILMPRAVYDRAINESIKVPELSGPFKMNPAQYREQLVLPDPSALYEACKQALRLPYCAMYGIFLVNDDKVEIDEGGASGLINSQTVYASNPDQFKLIVDLQEFVRLANSINEKLKGNFLKPNPATVEFCRNRFILTDGYLETGYGTIYTFAMKVDPEYLKELLV